ncbi:DedA family protein [Marinilabiliaceae bacterium JC017]|nr:DedA family protein [Marinilabiliaceae bacterium JC017]
MGFETGFVGLFLASFLAATVVPFSSEILLSGMLWAGYDPVLCFVTATLGNWLGGMSSYAIGYMGKMRFIEKYLRISIGKQEKIRNRIAGKELWISFFCWLPGFGDVIAVVLGLLKVNVWNVTLGMFIGKLSRYVVWGYFTLEAMRLL